jgi:outer membrane protein W
MIQRIDRILFLLFIVAGAARLSAQTHPSEIGVWVLDTRWTDTTLGPEALDHSGQFEEKTGYGISFNRFWTEQFSTEVSAQRFSADAVLGGHIVEGGDFFETGEIDVTVLSVMAQWHWNRAGRFSPYAGAGIARVSASFDSHDDNVAQSFDYESKVPPVFAAGANVRITERVFFAGEVRFIPWTLDRVEVDPLLFAAGVKVRF